MQSTPEKQALKKQLGVLRNEAVYARMAVESGGQPPHGFTHQMRQMLALVARANPAAKDVATRHTSETVATENQPWDLSSVDTLITLMDDALRVLGSTPQWHRVI